MLKGFTRYAIAPASRTFDQITLAERGQHHDRERRLLAISDAASVPARRLPSMITRSGLCSSASSTASGRRQKPLADNFISLLSQHLGFRVHADERFIFHDQARRGTAASASVVGPVMTDIV